MSERVWHDEDYPWGKIPLRAAVGDLSKDALRVLVVLSSYAKGTTREAWPSQDTIADVLGWLSKGKPDQRRVNRALNQLREPGVDLVRVKRRVGLAGGGWRNEYVVAPYTETVETTVTDLRRGTVGLAVSARRREQERQARIRSKGESVTVDPYTPDTVAPTVGTDSEQTSLEQTNALRTHSRADVSERQRSSVLHVPGDDEATRLRSREAIDKQIAEATHAS